MSDELRRHILLTYGATCNVEPVRYDSSVRYYEYIWDPKTYRLVNKNKAAHPLFNPIHHRLTKLHPHEPEIVRLREIGYRFPEIASELNIPFARVRAAVRSMRKRGIDI